MRLELHKMSVKDAQWGDVTRVADKILYVNKEQAIASVADDHRFAKVDLEIARPGESIRIIPIKDVIEPRTKMDGSGYFPGFCAPMQRAGEGATFVLDGAAVVTCGPIVAFQEGFVDMTGPGADYTPFSKTVNIVLVVEPVENIDPHAYEEALREAGLKLAIHLADQCKDTKADTIEVYEKGSIEEENKKCAGLPKVLYLCMSITQGLLHDTYVYGADLRPAFPTLLHPNEVLDGAVVSGNCVSACDKNTTYHHVHNPVVAELYARHGKDINFLGMVPTIESTLLDGKKRAALMNLNLSMELGANAVIISEEGYGNPDTDFCLNVKYHEDKGIVAVVISDEAAGTDGKSQSTADSTPELVSFISTGNVNEMVEVPPMDKVIGDAKAIENLSGGASDSLRPDGSMYVELQAIIASTCEVGFSNVSCEWI